MAEHMGEKRKQKNELLSLGLEVTTTQEPTHHRNCKEHMENFVLKAHGVFRDISRVLMLWQSDLHMIHGRYGIGAATYFHWLRTIISLNIGQTIMVFLLVVIPEFSIKLSHDHINITSCPTKVLATDNITCALLPSIAKEYPRFVDFITGAGYFRNGYFYYSGYRDSLADPFCPSHALEHVHKTAINITAFRFALVILFIFIINTIYLALQVRQHYHTAELESKIPGIQKKQKFATFFSSWDCSCTDPETAHVLHRNIWRGFKDALADKESVKRAIPAVRPYLEQKFESYWEYDKAVIAVHVVMSLLVVLVYAAAGGILWLSLNSRLMWKKSMISKSHPCFEFHDIPDGFMLLPALTMTFLYVGVGYFSTFIAQYESWGSQISKNLAFIARVGLYYFMTTGTIYGFFLHQAKISIKGLKCYENFFAHELYRLIVLQGVLYVTVTFISYNIYTYVQRRNSKCPKPEFDPVNYTMRLFYLHTLSGIGFFYCPFSSLLLVGRLIGTFYHHKRMLKTYYGLSSHIIQNSDIHAPFLLAYFLSYLTTTLMNLLVFSFHPSTVCGPFSHYNFEHTEEEAYGKTHYYQMFVEEFLINPNFFVIMLTSPGFGFVVIVFLIAFVYTLRQWGLGYLHTMEHLYDFLQLERKDRDFLLEAIYHFAKRNSKRILERQLMQQDLAATSDEKDVPEWIKSDMFEGIFTHRRGTLSGMMPLTRPEKQDRKKNKFKENDDSDVEELHGTVGKFLKQDFDWLPSQWSRRKRRSAAYSQLAEKDIFNFQELYRAALIEGVAAGNAEVQPSIKPLASNAQYILSYQ